jgi:hypothetical protein
MAWQPPPQPAQHAPDDAVPPLVLGAAPWRPATPAPATPPFVPYAQPVPATPPTRPVRALAAPIWERQPDEPAVAWTAFQGWLAPGAGGTTPGKLPGSGTGNWAEASAWVAEPSRAVLEAMAVEWGWEARRTAQAAFGNRKTPTAEARAQRAEARRLQTQATDLALLEVSKLIEECKATPAMRLTVKELIALFGRIGSIEVMRERAGILESLSAGANNGAAPAINWDAMTDDELEAYRRLGEKVGV